MLKANIKNIFILGIDEENIKRLKDNKPMVVNLSEIGGTDEFVLMYGPTIQAMRQELEQIFSKVDLELALQNAIKH